MSVHQVCLGDLIDPAKTRKAGSTDYPLLSMTMAGGLVDPATKFKKRIASEDTSGYKVVERGQLVVGFPIDEGVLSFQQLYDEAIVSPAYGIWEIRSGASVDPVYLEKFLKSPQAIAYYLGKLRSTTARRRSLDRGSFLALPVPLPPLEEQKRIAEILDQAAELCRLRTRALDKLGTLGQAIFHEMFGASDGGIGEWPTATLGELVADAQIGAVRGASEMSDEKVCEYLRMDAIGTDGSLDLNDLRRVDASDHDLEKYGLRCGDVLFNTRNSKELVGKTAVLRQDFSGIYNNNILRCRFFLPSYADFFDAYLRTSTGSHSLENIKSGTTSVFAVYQKALMSLRVPVPDEGLINEFASKIMASYASKSEYEKGIGFSESLFASLQHRVFRGEL